MLFSLTFGRTVAVTGVVVLVGSGGAFADPGAAALYPGSLQSAQAQPRDPRPHVARPATSREQELVTAVRTEPAAVANWLELAKLQQTRGAIQDAENTYRAAVTATAGSRDVLVAMGRFFSATGQFDKAVETLEDLAAQNPMDPTGHQLVATYYWEKAQKDQSLTPADKLRYIESGIGATDRALAQNTEYVEALTYKNILLRMKANLETDDARRQGLLAEADALRNRAMELTKGRRATTPATVQGTAGATSAPPPDFAQVDGQSPVRVGGTVKTPTKIHDVRPVYPQEAQDAHVSGMVIVEAVIDTGGNIRTARVLRSIAMLDEAALQAVRQWRFTPTMVDGVAVPVIMTVTVNFTLQQ